MSLGSDFGIEAPQNATKMTIERMDADKNVLGTPLTVAYNPKELSISKKVNYADIAIPGLDAPIVQFVRGDAETMSLSLFFDSSKKAGTGANAESVLKDINPFYALVKIDGNKHTPPIIRLCWGDENIGYLPNGDGESAGSNVFDAVVLNVDRKFLMFSTTGKPVRAMLSLSLKEYRTVKEQLEGINLQSNDHTRVYTVHAGDNLPGIAAKMYGASSYWRVIAEHNQIRNVRSILPGTVLELPPVVN